MCLMYYILFLDTLAFTTSSPHSKTFPTRSPWVKLSGRLPIQLHGYDSSHPLELSVLFESNSLESKLLVGGLGVGPQPPAALDAVLVIFRFGHRVGAFYLSIYLSISLSLYIYIYICNNDKQHVYIYIYSNRPLWSSCGCLPPRAKSGKTAKTAKISNDIDSNNNSNDKKLITAIMMIIITIIVMKW